MPVTTNWNIASPDDENQVRLVTDLATLGESVDSALTTVSKGANMYVGTAAQRAAFLAQAPRGVHWQDTDGNQREYLRGPTSWVEVQSGDFRRGTAGQRSLVSAQFGQIWQDSDGNKTKWKGRSDGTWTRMEGSRLVAAGAWDLTANGNSARTLTISLPCVLEATETLQITANGVGSGFGILSLNTITKNASDTTVVLRHMQLFSSAQNSVGFSWQITDSPA